MKCVETRTRPDGVRRRRYTRPGLPPLTTFEVPASVLREMGRAALAAALARHARGETARAAAAHVRATVAARPDWKSTALAHELGVTEQRVRQIRKELK